MLKWEGDLAHAVSFLPGFPYDSFGWGKVLQYLPSGAEMPTLFLDYVGMGDSDKPKDYAYSTAERTDRVEAIGAISPPNRQHWLPSTFLASRSRAPATEACALSEVNPRAATSRADPFE
ncbi:MAG: hypothetical protein JO356_02320 [Acidobacteria bacterium]|nr:hypothetical protein [Acidobacteriota bacterium]